MIEKEQMDLPHNHAGLMTATFCFYVENTIYIPELIPLSNVTNKVPMQQMIYSYNR